MGHYKTNHTVNLMSCKHCVPNAHIKVQSLLPVTNLRHLKPESLMQESEPLYLFGNLWPDFDLVELTKCGISLIPRSSPIFQFLYRPGPNLKDIEQTKVCKTLHKRVIEHSNSSFTSPVFLVPKHDDTSPSGPAVESIVFCLLKTGCLSRKWTSA